MDIQRTVEMLMAMSPERRAEHLATMSSADLGVLYIHALPGLSEREARNNMEALVCAKISLALYIKLQEAGVNP